MLAKRIKSARVQRWKYISVSDQKSEANWTHSRLQTAGLILYKTQMQQNLHIV